MKHSYIGQITLVMAFLVAVSFTDAFADDLTFPVTVGTSLSPSVNALIHGNNLKKPLPEVEFELASLELKRLDGELLAAEEFENKKVVLYFWSIYCRSCVGTMQDFEQWQQKLAEENITLLGIHLFESRVEKVAKTVSKLGITLPVLLAPNWVRDLFSIRVLPTSLVFDRSGKLTARFDGMSDVEGLKLSLFREVETGP